VRLIARERVTFHYRLLDSTPTISRISRWISQSQLQWLIYISVALSHTKVGFIHISLIYRLECQNANFFLHVPSTSQENNFRHTIARPLLHRILASHVSLHCHPSSSSHLNSYHINSWACNINCLICLSRIDNIHLTLKNELFIFVEALCMRVDFPYTSKYRIKIVSVPKNVVDFDNLCNQIE